MTELRMWVAATAVVLVVGGCTGDSGVSDTPTPSTSTPMAPASSTSLPAAPRSTTGDPQPTAGELARRVAEAKALAVRDRDARAEDLVVVRAERVSWPDSAYGCPATGRTYEPGPFPGYRIELADGDLNYTYTAAEDTELMECLFLE